MPSFSLSVAMRSAACMASKVAFVDVDLYDDQSLGGFGVEFARQVGFSCLEFGEKLRGDGEQVAAGQFFYLADVAEAGAHDLGL